MSGGKSSPDPYYAPAPPKKKSKQQSKPSEVSDKSFDSQKDSKKKKQPLDPSELPVKPLGPVKVIPMPKTKKKPPITGQGFTGLKWYRCDYCGEPFFKRKKVQGKSALCSPECISGWNTEWRKGLPKSEEHKQKIADAHRGRPKSEEHKKNLSKAKKEQYEDPEFRDRRREVDSDPARRQKIAHSKRGSRNPNWKGGPETNKRVRTPADQYRDTADWKQKAEEIRGRDNNTCQSCGKKGEEGENLDVHHVYPLNDWIEEGHEPNEYPDSLLITLDKSCHSKADAQSGAYKLPPNEE